MKILQTITNVVIVLAMVSIMYIFSYMAISSDTTAGAGLIMMLLFVLSPFGVLLLISNRIGKTTSPEPRRIALFIIAIFTCSITTATYYRITFYPGSSTDGIVFGVFPIYSFIFMAIAYPILRRVAGCYL